MCFTSTDVNYVTYYVRLLSLTPMTITSVGYGPSGCGTYPAPPSYLSCFCVSRREYACVIRTVTRNMNEDVWYCLPPGGDLSDESGDQTIVVTIGITAVSMIFPAGSSVSVINNTARQFRCETSAGNPQATVEWYKDSGTPDRADDTHITTGTEIDTSASDTLIVTIGKLTLTVQKNDQEVGVYCRANNGRDWLYSSNVPSTPKVSYKGSEVTSPVRLISGRSMALICSSIGNPSPTYTWTYPGGGSHSGSTITLAIVLKTHAGGVTCTAMNTLSPTGGAAVVMTRTTTISLQVLYPPSRPSCTTIGTSISTSAVLVEGTDSTFSCISYANPPLITYTWSTPGRGQVSGANVTLTKVHHHADQGQYTLTATNTMDPTIEISTPIVSYRDFAITSRVRVISGRSMTLNCSSTGNPSPAYAWTYPGGGSHVGPNLIFTSVQTTLAGNVTCTTWNTLSPTGEIAFVKTKQTTTSLQWKKMMFESEHQGRSFEKLEEISRIITTDETLVHYFEPESKQASIRAIYPPYSPDLGPLDFAYFPNFILSNYYSTYILLLLHLRVRLAQSMKCVRLLYKYICTMSNCQFHTKQIRCTNHMFTPVVGPKVQVPHTYNILEGAALSYPCLFIPGNPSKTSIVWTSSFDHRQWNSQIVSISSVLRSDDGMYTCTATNKMTPTGSPVQIGIHSGTTHINVHNNQKHFPDESLVSDFYVTEHIGTVNVTKSEHSDATFTCTVDSNPLSTLNIRKESEIRKSVENSKQLEYTIVNLTCWDAGLYTCDGSAPRRPPGGNIKTNFTARLHDNATLQYTVLAYPVPSPSQFVWKRCSSSTKCINLSNTSRKTEITTIGLSSSLTIFDISMDDFDVYTISIDNGIGEELVEEIFLQPVVNLEIK
ncbi:PXDN-like protein [Mya arenaria]|uniref:PXDN-like protein n=1 Tax=Mya arenaria TaxID=6604 RepID=A0ABY7EA20_MYAAR|nr:PXDN-like protein [Mya arenaria]